MEDAKAPVANGKPLKAVVFRDSFCGALIPFLSDHFYRSVYIWHYPLDKALVEAERPDVVILQMVERSLMTVSPQMLLPNIYDEKAPEQ